MVFVLLLLLLIVFLLILSWISSCHSDRNGSQLIVKRRRPSLLLLTFTLHLRNFCFCSTGAAEIAGRYGFGSFGRYQSQQQSSPDLFVQNTI
jgi:hypothetical protein